jgi:hypothetical protein
MRDLLFGRPQAFAKARQAQELLCGFGRLALFRSARKSSATRKRSGGQRAESALGSAEDIGGTHGDILRCERSGVLVAFFFLAP